MKPEGTRVWRKTGRNKRSGRRRGARSVGLDTAKTLRRIRRFHRLRQQGFEVTAGLRALADILDTHPEVPLPIKGSRAGISSRLSFHFLSDDDPRAAMAATRRALGVPTEKDDSVHGYFRLTGSLHGLHFSMTAFRNAVCERIVVGKREIEVEEPDAAAVAALPKVKRTVTVEDVEWRCAPLLAPVDDDTEAVSA